MTTPSLSIMFLLEGQLDAICPKPKHLKKILLEVLVGDFRNSRIVSGIFYKIGRKGFLRSLTFVLQ